MTGLRLSQVVEIADRLFPFNLAEPWDNCGIQIGDPDRLVSAIAFSLDPSVLTINYAVEHSCALLITHHPVLLEPLRNLVWNHYPGRTLIAAARSGVDILSLHTNLDAAPGGLNDYLAKVMGLEEVITPCAAPCARMGMLASPVRIAELAAGLARALNLPHLRVVSECDCEVQSVFSVCGSGMGYLKEALLYKPDVMVTGDVKYHAACEALEMGIPVIDAGHFGLEKGAPEVLATAFRKEFEHMGLEIACFTCEREKDPFFDIYHC